MNYRPSDVYNDLSKNFPEEREMQEVTGKVTHLFVKTNHGVPMVSCPNLALQVGHGIEGDVNAHAMSPRQILLVRQEDLDAFKITPGELRENVVISGIHPELFAPGATVIIGDRVTIRATFLCEACKRIAHVVPSLKSIAEKRGLLGVILSDGVIHVDSCVSVRTHQFPPLSDIPYYRFLEFIAKIPPGRVITYRQVVIGMGVADSYMRAIPMYIHRTSPDKYPLHRILDTEGKVIPYVPNQQSLLEAEKVLLVQAASLFDDPTEAFVPLNQYLWHDPTVYVS